MAGSKTEKRVLYISLIFLMSFGAFGYGFLVGHDKYWPHETLVLAKTTARTLLKTGELAPEGRTVLHAEGAPRERFHMYQAARAVDGYYAIMGWDNSLGKYAIWLYDDEGAQLHSWTLDYEKLDADGPRNKSDAPHGMQVLPDGSIVVNFDKGDVMARLDACSRPIWIKQGIFHHSIDIDEQGNLWTWRGEGTAYGDRQFLVQFDSETGETLQEIDFIDEIVSANADQPYIFSVRGDHEFRAHEQDPPHDEDLFHPNDIEVLPSRLAGKFDSFSTGDLLLSLRNLNLIAVLDPDTKRVRWWSRGPWTFQHDPDFTADGTISVFDNNSDRGRSEILTIDPVTNEIRNNLLEGDLHFYTFAMGEHSNLPNGNMLVVSPGEGRVVEVTSRGDKVLEFNNVISDSHNAHVQNGDWLPKDFYSKVPHCADEN